MAPQAKEYVAARIVETTPLRYPLRREEKEALRIFNETGCVGSLNSADLIMQSNGRIVRRRVCEIRK